MTRQFSTQPQHMQHNPIQGICVREALCILKYAQINMHSNQGSFYHAADRLGLSFCTTAVAREFPTIITPPTSKGYRVAVHN